MKKQTTNLMIGLTLSVALVACDSSKKLSGTDKTLIEAGKNKSAEELALAGEQLMGLFTFPLADKVLTAALEKDPNNKRAQFHKALIKPLLVLKGSAWRVRPLFGMSKHSKDLKEYDTEMAKFPDSPFKDFIMDRQQPEMRNARDVQNVLVEVRNAFNDMRKFLRANHGLELTLNLNPHMFENSLRREQAKFCRVVDESTFECDYSKALVRKINAADVIAMQQVAAGWVLFLSLYTNYSVDGIEQIIKDNANHPEKYLTPKDTIQALERLPGFGKLRADHSFGIFHELGADLASAWKWAMRCSRVSAPKGEPTGDNREGYLFSDGFCVPDSSKSTRDLAIFERVLQGPTVIKLGETEGEHSGQEVKIDVPTLYNRPVQDLRQIAPVAYNECGKATKLRDASFGGLLPNKDGHRFINPECDPVEEVIAEFNTEAQDKARIGRGEEDQE